MYSCVAMMILLFLSIQEVQLCAAIINMFHLIPAASKNLIEPLTNLVLIGEKALLMEVLFFITRNDLLLLEQSTAVSVVLCSNPPESGDFCKGDLGSQAEPSLTRTPEDVMAAGVIMSTSPFICWLVDKSMGLAPYTQYTSGCGSELFIYLLAMVEYL